MCNCLQDFKTAHLLGVAPSSQLLAMLLGSAASVPLSVAAYQLYTSAWQVPGPVLPAPMALIWLNMAKLVSTGNGFVIITHTLDDSMGCGIMCLVNGGMEMVVVMDMLCCLH
jgi:uncharacterized oligopeptide transporter (OPT) family protein